MKPIVNITFKYNEKLEMLNVYIGGDLMKGIPTSKNDFLFECMDQVEIMKQVYLNSDKLQEIEKESVSLFN